MSLTSEKSVRAAAQPGARVRGCPVTLTAGQVAVQACRSTLEYVSWTDAILREPMVIKQGNARPPQRPGLGLGLGLQ
ncbi:hypothetical protein [Polaromonas sp.]|uniref:hypothetical protein n=1 Tax=Polaromonas sp. TaxID=1869339 RepID=UPI00326426F7